MTETIIVNPTTGGAKGAKPRQMSYLPHQALQQVLDVYHWGALKYDKHNWRKGYDWSLSYDAMQRHLLAFWGGQDNDPESGLSHMGHVVFHALTLLTFMAEHPEMDDRWRPPPTGPRYSTVNVERTDIARTITVPDNNHQERT